MEIMNETGLQTNKLNYEIKWLLWRVSQLYNLKKEMNDECFAHIKALYAISKKLSNIIQQHLQNIPDQDFLQYIHQSVLFDFMMEEMNKTYGETPEYYKSKAKARLTTSMLRDILNVAVAQNGYQASTMDVRHYIDLYFKSPPWTINYFKDQERVYQKVKEHFIYWFATVPPSIVHNPIPPLTSDVEVDNCVNTLSSETNNDMNYYINNFDTSGY